MSKPSRHSTTLTPTVPTPLAALYQATSEARVRGGGEALPTISQLLREAMAAKLAALGIDPALLAAANPPPSRTTRATAARSRARLTSTKPSREADPRCTCTGSSMGADTCPVH